jgi:deoxyribodipyrimidine photolyase-like uncharacterized protein
MKAFADYVHSKGLKVWYLQLRGQQNLRRLSRAAAVTNTRMPGCMPHGVLIF